MTGFLVEWVAKIINNADILKLIFGIYFSFQRIVNMPILGHAKLIASSILMYGENRYLHKEFAFTLYGMPMIIHSATSRTGRAITTFSISSTIDPSALLLSSIWTWGIKNSVM